MKKKIAVFIDGDNVSQNFFQGIIRTMEKEGDVLDRRVYGDWSTPQLKGWLAFAEKQPFQMIQQPRLGKNATDGAIFMDAIEMTHTQSRVNSYCIVSSDSDFYSLAQRLRAKGNYVYGMGIKKISNDLLVNSCDHFIYIDDLKSGGRPKTAQDDSKGELSGEELVLRGMSDSQILEDGWIELGELGRAIRRQKRDYSIKDYGHSRLIDLVKAMDSLIEIKSDGKTPANYYIREREPVLGSQTGEVKRLMSGFGFIKTDAGEYFFSRTTVVPEDRETIAKGQTVRFEVIKHPNPEMEANEDKNGRAQKVQIIKRS